MYIIGYCGAFNSFDIPNTDIRIKINTSRQIWFIDPWGTSCTASICRRRIKSENTIFRVVKWHRYCESRYLPYLCQIAEKEEERRRLIHYNTLFSIWEIVKRLFKASISVYFWFINTSSSLWLLVIINFLYLFIVVPPLISSKHGYLSVHRLRKPHNHSPSFLSTSSIITTGYPLYPSHHLFVFFI